MPVLPSTRTHTNAVIAALETIGKPVGDAVTPANAGDIYFIVEPMPSGLDHPLTGDHRWARFVYHVKCVAIDRDGVEWLRDEARAVLLDESNLTIADRAVVDVVLETTSGVVRDDDARTYPLFWVSDRYLLFTDVA